MPLSLLMTLLLSGVPSPHELREVGTQAYRRGELRRACAAFTAVSRITPDDGDNWADLGLCLAKLGRKRESIAAGRKAALSSSENARKSAYFNLQKAGVRAKAPEPSPIPDRFQSGCETVATDACGSYFACSYLLDTSGQGGESYEIGLAIGRDLDQVNAAAGQPDGIASNRDPAPVVALPLYSYQSSYCHVGQQIARWPDGGLCQQGEDCTRADWECPPSNPSSGQSGCRIVIADPCNRRLGVYCGNSELFQKGVSELTTTAPLPDAGP